MGVPVGTPGAAGRAASPSGPRAAGDPHRVLPFLVLAGLALPLSQTLAVPALLLLSEQYGASPAAISWVLTAVLLVATVATPVIVEGVGVGVDGDRRDPELPEGAEIRIAISPRLATRTRSSMQGGLGIRPNSSTISAKCPVEYPGQWTVARPSDRSLCAPSRTRRPGAPTLIGASPLSP